MTDVVRLGPESVEPLAALLADAFLEGPVGDYLVPDLVQRERIYRAYFRIFTTSLLPCEQVVAHATTDMTAAAVWVDETVLPAPAILGYAEELAAACEDRLGRFQHLDELFARVHPHGPHWYLMFIGTQPQEQGNGLGSMLLEHQLGMLDERGLSAYLGASNVHNRRLYTRYGFQDAGQMQYLPDGPPIWPMWREPVPLG